MNSQEKGVASPKVGSVVGQQICKAIPLAPLIPTIILFMSIP